MKTKDIVRAVDGELRALAAKYECDIDFRKEGRYATWVIGEKDEGEGSPTYAYVTLTASKLHLDYHISIGRHISLENPETYKEFIADVTLALDRSCPRAADVLKRQIVV